VSSQKLSSIDARDAFCKEEKSVASPVLNCFEWDKFATGAIVVMSGFLIAQVQIKE
jgi:hypothetical protein